VLRIEDTDAARNSQEAIDVILSGLRWLGLDWDEGPTTPDTTAPGKGDFGPYFQSQRSDIYKRRLQELRDKDWRMKKAERSSSAWRGSRLSFRIWWWATCGVS